MTFNELWRPLTAIYDEGEARAIALLVLEERFGLSRADVLCGRMGDDSELQHLQQELLTGCPVQYVLGQAMFGGRYFHVEPGVLIPRPETYELCEWIVAEQRIHKKTGAEILDIGTGSGCIACTLADELTDSHVTAWDISRDALRIAEGNAQRLGLNVVFEEVDILSASLTRAWDLIVSNPPYICLQEAAAMERNVLDYEPHEALFVPDNDPLLFYRAIAEYALPSLRPGGALYFEINPHYATMLAERLDTMGYRNIETRQDQYGKTRMMKAEL